MNYPVQVQDRRPTKSSNQFKDNVSSSYRKIYYKYLCSNLHFFIHSTKWHLLLLSYPSSCSHSLCQSPNPLFLLQRRFNSSTKENSAHTLTNTTPITECWAFSPPHSSSHSTTRPQMRTLSLSVWESSEQSLSIAGSGKPIGGNLFEKMPHSLSAQMEISS